jgi:hypothetical protein
MVEKRHCHPGSCDCGAIQFEYYCSRPLTELSARACQCDFCRPLANTYLSEPDGLLRVKLRDMRYLYAHCFGTRSADFQHCAICNALVYVTSEIDGHVYALVVARALKESPPDSDAQAVDYAAETLEQRLQRRAQRWISNLEVVTGVD